MIYINDLPSVCKTCQAFLFADDTSLIAINSPDIKIAEDLRSIELWLKSNKLTLNVKKTCLIRTGTRKSASVPALSMNDETIPVAKTCNYLGVHIDDKFNFVSHIMSVKEKLSKQCGINPKLRYFVPRKVLLRYYSTNIKPIIQYGILIYGCVRYSNLELILKLQKKIVRLILFLEYRDNVSHLFERNLILSVHELYVYELLKFVIRSLNKMNADEYLNNLYGAECPTRSTRRSEKRLLKIPKSKTQIERSSLKFRGSKLFNILLENVILSNNFDQIDETNFATIVHTLRDSYILSNYQLIKSIFS